MTDLSPSFDLEGLVHLEQTFYDAGYADGHAHGRIHGLIEGRALGREKGYQLWEEIGFYEGFANLWAIACRKSVNSGDNKTAESRAEIHVRHLLELVAQFPHTNPSQTSESDDAALDVAGLLSKIRARYKALCSTLGVRPRLKPATQGEMVAEVPPTQKGKTAWKINKVSGSTEMSF